MKPKLQFVLALMIATILVASANAIEPTTDSLDTVKENIAAKKAVLLDVREKGEWDNGHLKDAIHLPLSQIKKGTTVEELEKITGKDTIVYLHCAAGVRSLQAAEKLSNSGRDLRPLKPGFDALVKAGFPKAK